MEEGMDKDNRDDGDNDNRSDISIKMRQSGMEREENLNTLRKKIDSLEKWKQDMIHNARKELTHLARIHKDLESKGRLVLMEQEERIQALQETHQEEMRRYRKEAVRLKQTIEIEQQEYEEKEKVVMELKRVHEEKMRMLRAEEKEFKEQIDSEQKRLSDIEAEHDSRQNKFETEIEARREKFLKAKDEVLAQIKALDDAMLQKKESYTKEINRLSHELGMLQNEIEKKEGAGRDEVNRLIKEREEQRVMIKEMEQRLAELKIKEEERIAVILKDHQTRYVEMEKEFEHEAKPVDDELGKLRAALRERERALEKFRDEKDKEYQQAVSNVSRKIQELDDVLYKTKAANKKELREKEEALQKHFIELDDKVLQKQQELHHLENNYMAEEALLRLQLDALRQHEMVLSSEDPERKKMFADRIQRLKDELAKAKSMADQEQEKYNMMRKNLENQLDSERGKLQSQTISATSKINELDDRIIQLKAELRTKKDILKVVDSKTQEKLESIQDELLRQKDANAKEANLLKDAFCDLANKLKRQRKEKSEIIKALEKECTEQRKIQQHDIENLQHLIAVLKQQGEKVKNNLESELSDLVNNNAGLKEQFDNEVAQLQMDMVAKVCGSGQQNKLYQQLVSKFEELQQLLPKRRSELAALIQQHKSNGSYSQNNQEIEALQEKVREESDNLKNKNNPIFDEGGLAHQLFIEKSKNDALQEEYKKQKEALEKEINAQREDQNSPRKPRNDSKHVVHLKKAIAKEVDENESLQKEIADLESKLQAKGNETGSESEDKDVTKVQIEISRVENDITSLQETKNSPPTVVSSEVTRLKKHLDDVSMEYGEEKADLEDKVSSLRGEITSTKRKSWKEKEAQDLEIQKLEKLSEEERKKFKKEFTKQRDSLKKGNDENDSSKKTEKPNQSNNKDL